MSIWQRRHGETRAAPSVRMMTREGCCLCDEARHVLDAHGLAVEEVDIDRDPQLRKRYTNCVPVVIIDGKERFRGRVDPVLLRRLLQGRRPNSQDTAPSGSIAPADSDSQGAKDAEGDSP